MKTKPCNEYLAHGSSKVPCATCGYLLDDHLIAERALTRIESILDSGGYDIPARLDAIRDVLVAFSKARKAFK